MRKRDYMLTREDQQADTPIRAFSRRFTAVLAFVTTTVSLSIGSAWAQDDAAAAAIEAAPQVAISTTQDPVVPRVVTLGTDKILSVRTHVYIGGSRRIDSHR